LLLPDEKRPGTDFASRRFIIIRSPVLKRGCSPWQSRFFFACLARGCCDSRANQPCLSPQRVVAVCMVAVECLAENVLDLISRADQALYLAKMSYRLQMVAARQDDVSPAFM